MHMRFHFGRKCPKKNSLNVQTFSNELKSGTQHNLNVANPVEKTIFINMLIFRLKFSLKVGLLGNLRQFDGFSDLAKIWYPTQFECRESNGKGYFHKYGHF